VDLRTLAPEFDMTPITSLGGIVGNPDITPTFEFCLVGGHSPETRTVVVFLFGLVNERIGDDVLIDQLRRAGDRRAGDRQKIYLQSSTNAE
jgi:hypothetical protein